MSTNKNNTIKDIKVSPTSSDEHSKIINGDKAHENLSDDENLSGFDSDSEDETRHNGK